MHYINISLAAWKSDARLFLARDKSVWTTPGAYTEETPRKPVAGEQSHPYTVGSDPNASTNVD